MTNEERIKSLSTEELAQKFWEIITCENCPLFEKCKRGENCVKQWVRWLKSEVEE